ncbi:MAG: 16S rRNA (adenine(1518)-N(6)/adenine(1519)-N(6))-dimethyltransferase RsmA [Patescibacteria group bacterium]
MEKIDQKFVNDICAKYDIHPSKSLGQNFLISENVLNRIIEKADLKPADHVLEVGPGLGALTQKIFPLVTELVAIEKDRKMIAILEDRFRDIKNLKIINQDILDFDPTEFGLTDYKVVANLPYQISSSFLEKFLSLKTPPSEMILMFQKEVGEKLCALPGEMSVLSVATQLYAEPEILFQVSNTKFFPVPKVDSVVVRLKLKKIDLKIESKNFFKIVRAGFASKRKKLRNNLKSLFPEIDLILQKINLRADIRAEDLTVADWIRLYDFIESQK